MSDQAVSDQAVSDQAVSDQAVCRLTQTAVHVSSLVHTTRQNNRVSSVFLTCDTFHSCETLRLVDMISRYMISILRGPFKGHLSYIAPSSTESQSSLCP